jgi:protein-disulfide isomerase
MTSPQIAKVIADNLNLARDIHVPGTPTFIVDGHLLTQPSVQIDFPALAAAARRARG